MKRKMGVILIALFWHSLALKGAETGCSDLDHCAKNFATCIVCATACFDSSKDPWRKNAATRCGQCLIGSSLCGCTLMVCGCTCFPGWSHPEVMGSMIALGAFIECPAACATAAEISYKCARCLDKRAFSNKIEAMRAGEDPDGDAFKHCFQAFSAPFYACAQILMNSCCGESDKSDSRLIEK